MTDGEKMVWSAAFALSSFHGATAKEAASIASHMTQSLVSLRGDIDVDHMLVEKNEGGGVEAALVEALSAEAKNVAICAIWHSAQNLQEAIERRIGRPLRGAK